LGKEKQTIKNHLGKNICAFRNSWAGGTLWFGVKDNGDISGFEMNLKQRDHLNTEIDDLFSNAWDPAIERDTHYFFEWVPVYRKKRDKAPKSNFFVLKVRVLSLWSTQAANAVQFFHGEAYKRMSASVHVMKGKEMFQVTQRVNGGENKEKEELKQQELAEAREEDSLYHVLRNCVCTSYLRNYASETDRFLSEHAEVKGLQLNGQYCQDCESFCDKFCRLGFPAEFADLMEFCRFFAIDAVLWIPGQKINPNCLPT